MKIKIMIGFWFQPGSDVIDHLVELDPSLAPDRAQIERMAFETGLIEDDSQLFHALLKVEDDGTVNDAIIIDKIGYAVLTEGQLVDPMLKFCKEYNRVYRDDIINYEFKYTDKGYYDGRYWGDAVGKGFARCYLFDPDPSFFNLPALSR